MGWVGPPFGQQYDLQSIHGQLLTARDWSLDFAKLDVPLSVQALLKRWGRNVTPAWIYGAEVTAPAAGTALVSRTVSTGKSGYIYGFLIITQEANNFKVNWTSGGAAKSLRIVMGTGTLYIADFVALNEGAPADAGSTISITNVNAGSTGIVYQAALLYAEV